MVQEEIMQSVALARTAHDASARTAAAQHVAGLITPLSALEVSETTISEIEGLLDSPYDPVRYWTARALGNLGPRARRAIPKLLEMLPKADCLQGSKTSASGIRFALKQMGVAPPPAHCGPS